MTTYGHDTPFWKFFLGFLVAAALIVGAAISAMHDSDARRAKEQAAPCSYFENLTLDKVPARCITTEGGFKQ